MRKRSYFVISLLFVGLLTLTWWYFGKSPTPIDELLPPDADIDLSAYDGSMSPDVGSPDVLILGTSHLAQMDHDFGEDTFERVRQALSQYDPDMMVVEYLPADYPVGEGRDYRRDFDLERYAEAWDLEPQFVDSIIAGHRRNEAEPEDPCELARAYFLRRDFANASYYWLSSTCEEVGRDDEFADWLNGQSEDEMARIGFPVARQHGIQEVVSFDYQGEDAEWFIHETFEEALRGLRLGAIREFWPMLPHVGTAHRERAARINENDLIEMLHDQNSPGHIGFQYWVYEELIRGIDWEGAGDQQVDNYWLRNERMFEYMQRAIDEEDPERVLVVVGSGHKYFLDELVREAGYRWIDPREWLPPVTEG